MLNRRGLRTGPLICALALAALAVTGRSAKVCRASADPDIGYPGQHAGALLSLGEDGPWIYDRQVRRPYRIAQLPGWRHRLGPDDQPQLQPPAASGKALVVDQARQMLYVFLDGVAIRALPASTGHPSTRTPAFNGVVGRYVPTIWGFGYYMDDALYVTRDEGNIYIHGSPYTLTSGGQKLYAAMEHLGTRPSSPGCVVLHAQDAAWLVALDVGGVPLVITPLP